MNLRRVLLISTAFSTVMLAGANGAFAQDYDWSGFYVGVGVGAFGSSDGGTLSWMDPNDDIWNNTALTGTSMIGAGDEPILGGGTLEDFPGQLGGFGISGSVGFNAEMDNFLVGVEASILTGPFKAEDTFRESGTVSYTTSSITTLSATTLSTSLSSTTSTFYSTSTSTLTSTFTHTTTITNSVSTTTSTYTDTYSTYQTTTVVIPGSSTVEYPTSTIVTSLSTTTIATSSSVSTSTFSTSVTFSTGESTATYTTNGEWNETITGRAQIDWLATIKGRVGITADRTLFFVTGGLAVAQISQETTATLVVDGNPSTTSVWHGENTETKFGFVVGAGIEQALDEHWIISGEAEYYNLGTAEYDVDPQSGGATSTAITGHQSQTLDGGSVKFGIKYKF
jgi:opacity protein-like surface antigen